MELGFFSLVLHAHLPYVRHPEHEYFLEEDWFFEAITETYIPLLDTFKRLESEEVPFRITMTFTPTLLAMLDDEILKERYIRHLLMLKEVTDKQLETYKFDTDKIQVIKMYHNRINHCYETFKDTYQKDLIAQFRYYDKKGYLECITSAATHAYLPLISMYPESVYAQLNTAVVDFKRHFHRAPRGIWLPECAYYPGLDKILDKCGIKFFFLDVHGIVFGSPRPLFANLAPVRTPNGLHAFSRDIETSKMVWSREHGYPGDGYYRDFYRDIGYEEPLSELFPFIKNEDERKFTGLKYYRITDQQTNNKMLYEPIAAEDRAKTHANHFVASRVSQIRKLKKEMKRSPLIVSTYDAELFGHWWFEGPVFIEYVLRAFAKQNTIRSLTPLEYLAVFPENQTIEPCQSSWGEKGYHEFWLNEMNDWIYPHIHKACERMRLLVSESENKLTSLNDRALKQAARELLLAQSSDWPFIMKTGTMVDYAKNRFRTHIARFTKLYENIQKNTIDEKWLTAIEAVDNIFPAINYKDYKYKIT